MVKEINRAFLNEVILLYIRSSFEFETVSRIISKNPFSKLLKKNIKQ